MASFPSCIDNVLISVLDEITTWDVAYCFKFLQVKCQVQYKNFIPPHFLVVTQTSLQKQKSSY